MEPLYHCFVQLSVAGTCTQSSYRSRWLRTVKMQVLPALLNLDTRAVHAMTSADRHDRSLMASRLKYSSCMGLAPQSKSHDVYRETRQLRLQPEFKQRHTLGRGEAVVECRADKTGHKARVLGVADDLLGPLARQRFP
jgi:hypothetical protein